METMQFLYKTKHNIAQMRKRYIYIKIIHNVFVYEIGLNKLIRI